MPLIKATLVFILKFSLQSKLCHSSSLKEVVKYELHCCQLEEQILIRKCLSWVNVLRILTHASSPEKQIKSFGL